MRFLFLDRILEVEPAKRILATKLINMGDGYLVPHPSGRPAMPASILLECLAQTGGDLNLLTHGLRTQTFLIMAEGFKLRRQPHVGELLQLDMRMERVHDAGASMEGVVRSGSELIATLGRMMYVHRQVSDMSYVRRQQGRMRALLASPEILDTLPPVPGLDPTPVPAPAEPAAEPAAVLQQAG